ncbi:MAG: 50S ribosomal protein L10 [Dehalococcoidia bacterium]|nr:50S ribosomal protein L10 [Dehalococcoidia bacterium]
MLRQEKNRIVEQLVDRLSRSTIVIATSYQGLSARDMAGLRLALNAAPVSYQVVKNTLTRLAAQRSGKEEIMSIIDGPTALLFGYGDVVDVAKVLTQSAKSVGVTVQLKGALLEGRTLSASEVMTLSNLPSKEILISQLIYQLQATARNLHNILSFPLYGLSNVLQARIQNLTE